MRARDEAGFTLPELLLSVAIVGVVLAAIADGFLVGVHTTHDADRRIAESTDTQLVAAWFPGDVQSAALVSTSTSTCAVAGDATVLGLSWTDGLGTGAVRRDVAYVLAAGADGLRLVRRTCRNGTPASHTLARFVAADGATATYAPPVVTLSITDLDGRTQRFTATRRSGT